MEYAMTYEELKHVLKSSETVEVEFKTARGGLPGSLWETYSSFGNTQGGQIVLGVKQKGYRFVLDGRWECNLFQFYRRVYNRLSELLPKPFALKDGIRVEESPLHVSLREAFVNALIHCDYTMNANVVIANYKNKFVFSNPGCMLVTLNQYFHGGDSVCRNKSLQQMFMLIGSAEKAGSGADKIWSGWKQGNFRNPSIEETDGKVTLEMPLVSILSDDVIAELVHVFGDNIKAISHEKLLVLAACVSDGYVSNYRLQFVLDRHPVEITQLLKELCEEGLLKASGIGKGTKYKLNVASKVSENVASKVSSGRNISNRTLQLYRSIQATCTDFMPLMVIAPKVNRQLRYLKNTVIPDMVAKGLLERKYPNIPNHPDQQYRCVKIEE